MVNNPDIFYHPLVNPGLIGDERWEVVPAEPPPALPGRLTVPSSEQPVNPTSAAINIETSTTFVRMTFSPDTWWRAARMGLCSV